MMICLRYVKCYYGLVRYVTGISYEEVEWFDMSTKPVSILIDTLGFNLGNKVYGEIQ